MGRCHEFGLQIREGCSHAMVAGKNACSCTECRVVCGGRFAGCPDVWARGPQRGTLTLSSEDGPAPTPTGAVNGEKGPERLASTAAPPVEILVAGTSPEPVAVSAAARPAVMSSVSSAAAREPESRPAVSPYAALASLAPPDAPVGFGGQEPSEGATASGSAGTFETPTGPEDSAAETAPEAGAWSDIHASYYVPGGDSPARSGGGATSEAGPSSQAPAPPPRHDPADPPAAESAAAAPSPTEAAQPEEPKQAADPRATAAQAATDRLAQARRAYFRQQASPPRPPVTEQPPPEQSPATEESVETDQSPDSEQSSAGEQSPESYGSDTTPEPVTATPATRSGGPGPASAAALRWFEGAFAGLRSELQSLRGHLSQQQATIAELVGGITQQQALLSELLDARDDDFRLAEMADALPQVVSDAVAHEVRLNRERTVAAISSALDTRMAETTKEAQKVAARTMRAEVAKQLPLALNQAMARSEEQMDELAGRIDELVTAAVESAVLAVTDDADAPPRPAAGRSTRAPARTVKKVATKRVSSGRATSTTSKAAKATRASKAAKPKASATAAKSSAGRTGKVAKAAGARAKAASTRTKAGSAAPRSAAKKSAGR